MSHIKEQQILFDKDSDMLFLGSYAYAMDDSRRLFYNYEGSIYADFKKFEPFYGNIALHFFILHSLTMCDKKFYYHYWRSFIPWNGVTKCTLFLSLIENLGKDETASNALLNNCMEFACTYV